MGVSNITEMAYEQTTDWAKEGGFHVPMALVPIPNDREYEAVIQFVDEFTMSYYDNDLTLVYGTNAPWSDAYRGWLVKRSSMAEAWDTIVDLNSNGIPMSDSIEWDSYHDKHNKRVLFYPHFPGRVGEPVENDHWALVGIWDDVTRSFVFTEDDWYHYMTFYGYTLYE